MSYVLLSSSPLILLDSVSPVPLLLLVESSPPAPETQNLPEKNPQPHRGQAGQPAGLRGFPTTPVPREGGLTPVRAAVQGIVQYGAAQGGEATAAPQVGLAHHGLAVVGGLGAGGGRQALRAARFPPDRPAGGAEGLISHAWLWGRGGGGITVRPRGRKRGIRPNPLAAITSLRLPHGKFRKVQTAAS